MFEDTGITWKYTHAIHEAHLMYAQAGTLLCYPGTPGEKVGLFNQVPATGTEAAPVDDDLCIPY